MERNASSANRLSAEETPAPLEDKTFVLSERYFLDLVGVLAASISVAMFCTLGLKSLSLDDFLLGSVVVSFVAAFVLVVAAFLNDFLIIREKGFYALIVVAFVGVCGGSFLLLANVLFAILVAVGYVSLLLLWTNYLVVQKHHFLNVVLLLAFLLAGSAVLFSMTIDNAATTALFANVFAIVSMVAAYISKSHYRVSVSAFYSREESRANMQTRKSNFSKNFADGFVLGISFALFTESLAILEQDMLYIGGVVIVAAVASCLLRYTPNLNYETFMNWHMVLFFAVLFLVYPLVGPSLQVAISAAALFLSICFVLILIAAMSEFAKTVRISCFYEFGIDGAYFFFGLGAGLSLLLLTFLPGGAANYPISTALACDVAVIVLVWLNIDIVKGGYPHPEEFGTAKEKRVAPRHGASWKAKVNSVAQAYALSPRQKEVLLLLARGRNASYIMNELCVSNATVKSHIYSVYRKLGVHTQQELIDLIEDVELV